MFVLSSIGKNRKTLKNNPPQRRKTVTTVIHIIPLFFCSLDLFTLKAQG